MPKFKGGNITLNSGGIGPDDYIFRALPRGHYYKVTLRVKQGRDAWETDKAAMIYVFRNLTERLCLSDAQAAFQKRPDMQAMNFWTFANRFGKGDFRRRYPELLAEVKKVDKLPLGHPRRLNASGRQVCCQTCHKCLNPLREVLDGELWCDACQTYR